MTMKKTNSDRSGGANVHFKKTRYKVPKLVGLLIITLMLFSSTAFAQGSIFGTVTNSDASTPANGEISFFGLLDDTDEEIRIESCIGAGYDGGNWFDDFQNYLTEAAGNPYDYYFFNTTNGEGAVLSSTIPNNSFQQENILLAPVSTWPTVPVGLIGRVVSSSSVVVSFNGTPGLTYHIYRRLAASNGSFFRIDDPSGSLSNPGVTEMYYTDNTVDGVSDYHYLVIAEDASGNYSRHSAILPVSSGVVEPPQILAVSPDSGAIVGGTTISITGRGFDMNGAVATIDGNLLTLITVVSPFELTGLTAPGVAVGSVDLVVTNIASTLASPPLVGGYTYILNTAPILNPIGPQVVIEDQNLNFIVTAVDPDSTIPAIYTSTLPGTAIFNDNFDGTGTFDWTPSFADSGTYLVTFYAADAEDTVFEDVTITVTDAGNQPPVLDSIGARTIAENFNLNFNITASDLDGDTIYLSVENLPTNVVFVDSGNGVGNFDFNPDFTQEGTYSVIFKAFDGIEVDSEVVAIDVSHTNQPPILATIGAQLTSEEVNLNFLVTATDGDGEAIILTTSALPGTAVFADSGNGVGLFDWTPGYNDSGSYSVTFYADDGFEIDSELVTITVNDAGNQPPVLDSIFAMFVNEGDTLIQNITASDADGDSIQLFADSLPLNSSFIDSGNGIGTFIFTPDFNQAGVINVLFSASDGLLADSELVVVTVSEFGNHPPIIVVSADTTINEGDTLTLVVNASDPDGAGVILSATSSMIGFNFVDSGNGVGVFRYEASYYDAGIDSVWFVVADLESPPAIALDAIQVIVVDVNQPPVLDSIGPFGVAVDDTLSFTVTASDPTDPVGTNHILLTAISQPPNSGFVDNGDNTGTFTFYPDTTQVGIASVSFIATDMDSSPLSDNLVVNINVVRENNAPVWDSLEFVNPLEVLEGETAVVRLSATDPDGDLLTLYPSKIPENAIFTDSGNGAGVLSFSPNYVQAGLAQVTLVAYDGVDDSKVQFIIQIYEAGNQAPIVNSIPPDTVVEGNTLNLIVSATDPDATIPVLTADSLPENAVFFDNEDGTGTITFNPTYIQSGTYNVYIIADDGEFVDTGIVVIVVDDAGNQFPSIFSPGQQTVTEGQVLTFTITSSDPDMTTPILSAGAGMPAGATFTDNNDYSGTFNWSTTYTDQGTYIIWFLATDSVDPGLVDSIFVGVTVDNFNLLPRVDMPIQQIDVNEGDTAYLTFYVEDPDGPIPFIVVDTANSQYDTTVMTFTDSLNGWGWLTITPDFDVVGRTSIFENFVMNWFVVDSEYPEDTTFPWQATIQVWHVNRPPHFVQIGSDATIDEGENVFFQVTASDSDGTGPSIRAENLPANATFSGVLDYSKSFNFNPDFTQSGVYPILFIATDNSAFPILEDTVIVTITVLEVGNQSPYFTTGLPWQQPVVGGDNVSNLIMAFDPDNDSMVITIDNLPANATFVDSGNGVALFDFNPVASQIDSIYSVNFVVRDSTGAADTLSTSYRVIAFFRGDANSDGDLDMLDIMYLVNFLYKDGPAPPSDDVADANHDSIVNIMDPTYLVSFFYKQGPPPPGD